MSGDKVMFRELTLMLGGRRARLVECPRCFALVLSDAVHSHMAAAHSLVAVDPA